MPRVPLIEFQQKLTDSANPAGANWTALNLSARTANFGLNPFGTATDSCQLNEATTGVTDHGIFNSAALITFTETGYYCWSCWMKAGTRNFGGAFFDLGGDQYLALWNLTTGANTTLTKPVSITDFYGPASSLVAYTWPTPSVAGWFRFGVAFEVLRPMPPAIFVRVSMSDNGTNSTYAGVAGQTLEIWNPQLVKADWPGSNTVSNPATVNAALALRNLEDR